MNLRRRIGGTLRKPLGRTKAGLLRTVRRALLFLRLRTVRTAPNKAMNRTGRTGNPIAAPSIPGLAEKLQ